MKTAMMMIGSFIGCWATPWVGGDLGEVVVGGVGVLLALLVVRRVWRGR